ncbi:hypothetical protein CDAR_125791 [Caerostris darwini]|uniref:Ycf15 n=1 Tax=Caerostris darwini TaxID=1538125 RepID=A0AAV4S0E6_9ARAC|nr:hypothetical protein CDAR_125791 [Caerostris darwini]
MILCKQSHLSAGATSPGRPHKPQSTAGAENHSHLLPTHLFEARRFSERNSKKNLYFPLLWVSLHGLLAFNPFALQKKRRGVGVEEFL